MHRRREGTASKTRTRRLLRKLSDKKKTKATKYASFVRNVLR